MGCFQMEISKLIKQGAEAKIYVQNYLGRPTIIKERFVKKYRHPDLDDHLTRERIKAECRAILKCRNVGIRTPAIYLADLKRRKIYMEYFKDSISVKDFIIQDKTHVTDISSTIGKQLAKMHSNNITHGDLTTSNMLLVNEKEPGCFDCDFGELKLIFIDFGLAQLESSAEDKGVDLYVLERALISTHDVANKIFPIILKSYKEYYDSVDVLKKYEEVKARGRKRTMVG